MIKAVIFDCFGVLATEAWLPFKEKYFAEPGRYEEASDLMKQANAGLISLDEFLEQISKKAGLGPAEVLKALRQNVPNEPLFDYIRRELKPGYKLGFLSNVADDYMRKLFSAEQLGLFDCVTLSYKTGFIKPETKAYTIVAERLGVKPAECVLVDDKQSNVSGAEQAGMHGILYRDFGVFKGELEQLLNSKS